jgi:hypothetical protein
MLFSGIKKYIVGLIIKTSSDADVMEREKVYLNKLNMILVQVRLSSKIRYSCYSCRILMCGGFCPLPHMKVLLINDHPLVSVSF